MNRQSKFVLRAVVLVVISIVLVGIATAAVPLVKDWWKKPPAETPPSTVHILDGKRNSFEIPTDVAHMLGLDKKDAVAEVHSATHSRPLELSGTLAIDTNYLVRIHSRFAGEVVKIGEIEVEDEHKPGQMVRRPIRFGDKVHGPVQDREGHLTRPGQLLAELWSKDLGEKKSELVDAISQFRVDQETLSRMLKFSDVIPERNLREQEAKVAQDRNQVFKAERTLRVWRLSDKEIDEVKQEAEEIFKSAREAIQNAKPDAKAPALPARDPSKLKDWGKVEIRAPFDGTVLEKNVAIGDIVDTSADLFKIADLRHLSIWAHAYEEDLPKLLALSPQQRRWTVHVISPDAHAHDLPGTITKIGDIIDPSQHTALVLGHVENPKGWLRAGQFVTATVNLPADPDEVEIPTVALIENGAESSVLVQTDPDRYEYQVRKVAVARRTADVVCLRTRLSTKERDLGITALQPGERVVTVAVLELTAAYREQLDAKK